MKRQPIVHAPDVAVAVEQAMPALAIGVVDDDVEGGHRPEGVGSSRHQREVMLGAGGNDELLQRARSHRTVGAINRNWNDLPIERGADQEGGHLTLAQRAVWKIIEWRLALRRFIHTERFRSSLAAHMSQVGVVGTIGHEPACLDAALAQQALPRVAIGGRRDLRHELMMSVEPRTDAAIVVDGTAAHGAWRAAGADEC